MNAEFPGARPATEARPTALLDADPRADGHLGKEPSRHFFRQAHTAEGGRAARVAAFVQSKVLATQAHEIGYFGIFINR